VKQVAPIKGRDLVECYDDSVEVITNYRNLAIANTMEQVRNVIE
jgi:hypothetical protein